MKRKTARALLAAGLLLAGWRAEAQVYGQTNVLPYGQTYPNSLSGGIVSPVQPTNLNTWNASQTGNPVYGSSYNPNYVTTNQYGVNTGYVPGGAANAIGGANGQSQPAPKVNLPDDVMSVGRTGSYANVGGATQAKADPAGERMEGFARVVDGKTLMVGASLVVLDGADSPSADQTCTDPRGMAWECGRRAKDRLNQLVAGQHVVCVGISQAKSGVAARCKVGTTDLGKTMVQDGYAMSPKAVSPVYMTDQVGAENGRRGMWLGTFKNPWEARAGK